MSTAAGKAGRPPQVVDRETQRDLTSIARKIAKAEQTLEALWSERDEAISRAYMGGTVVRQIALYAGVTEKTAHKSLRRSGAIDDN